MRECQSRSKIPSQKHFSTFFKTCLLHVSELWDNFKRKKIFSNFQTNLSPGIVMRFERQKLPLTCNQRRRTLPVRITWKREWSSGVSLRCESASRGQKFSKSKNFSTFFKTCLLHVSGLWDNLKRKKFFRISGQSESRYRNEIRKAETPPYL